MKLLRQLMPLLNREFEEAMFSFKTSMIVDGGEGKVTRLSTAGKSESIAKLMLTVLTSFCGLAFEDLDDMPRF